MGQNGGYQKARPFLGVLFRCCHVYARIYLNKEGTAYIGRCPRCGAVVKILTSSDGSRTRFWEAGR